MAQYRSYPYSPEDLKRLAIIDELTGLYNRRYFKFRLNEELERARRSDRELAILLLDLDGLKSVNDMYGHLRGDKLLADFSDVLSGVLRPFDLVARYAGDEFVVLLPESPMEEAIMIAERIRHSVAEAQFQGEPTLRVTTSIGVAAFPKDGDDAETLIHAADRGLYTAKRQGRNRLATAEQDTSEKSVEAGLLETRLIGRDEELFLLRKAMSDMVNGRSNTIIVTGEPGVGRSRLLSEYQSRAAQTGVLTLTETCYEQSRYIPYQPIRNALRQLFSARSHDAYRQILTLTDLQRAEMLRILPDLEPSRLRLSEKPLRMAGQEEFQLFDAVYHFFKQLTTSSPVAVILDDLHWLDEASMKLIGYVLRHAREQRFLVIGSYRDVESGDTLTGKLAFSNWLRSVKNATRLTTIRLYRFNRARTREMVHSLLGQAFPVEFTNFIHSESEGNPFFIREILKSLIERQSIERTQMGWEIRDLDRKQTAPASIREFIINQLEALDSEDREILSMCAVIGRMFDFDSLQLVTGRNEGHLLDVLERLESAQIIRQRPSREGERYQFIHRKVQQVLYDQLDKRRLKRIHRAAAEALERVYSGRTEYIAGELAFHYIQSGEIHQAVELYKSAGDKARQLHAESSALRYYSRAIRLIQKHPGNMEEHLCSLHKNMAEILRDQGRRDRAINEYLKAIKFGASTMPGVHRADLLREIALLHINNGRFDKAAQAVANAEKLLNPDTDRLELIRLTICKAASLLRRGEYEACLEQTRKPIEELKSTENLIELSDLYDLTASANYFLGERDSAVRLFSESLELRRRAKDLARISTSYNNLAGIFMEASRWDDAIFWYRKCIKIEESFGRYSVLAEPHAKLSEIFVRQGNLKKAEKHIRLALEICELANDNPGIAHCLVVLMGIHLENNDLESARQILSRAEEIDQEHEIGVSAREVAAARAQLQLLQGNPQNAQTIAQELYRTLELFGDPAGKARAAFLNARIATELQHFTDAMDFALEAERLYEELGNRFEMALCIKQRGLILLAQDQDRKALAFLAQARDIFVEIGSHFETKKLEDLLARHGAGSDTQHNA